MPNKIEIDNEEYELVQEPSHGMTRRIRSEQMDLGLDYVDLDDLDKEEMNMPLMKLIQKKLKEKPRKLMDFLKEKSEFQNYAAISLATNDRFEQGDLDGLSESRFNDIVEKCEESIGGSVQDFIKGSGRKSSRRVKEEEVTKES